MTRTALVSTALPYANGPLHLGHLVGYIQADVWVRARRLRGDKTFFVCADDTHGTPIMLAAEKAGVTPETFIANIQASHERDFAAFGVAFDHYDSTNSAANKALTEQFYLKLEAAGHISRRSVAQFYDPAKGMFLPDRYVKGICPNCGSPHIDQTHRQDPELLGCTCCGLVDDLLQFRPVHLLGKPTPAPQAQGSRLRAPGRRVQEDL